MLLSEPVKKSFLDQVKLHGFFPVNLPICPSHCRLLISGPWDEV